MESGSCWKGVKELERPMVGNEGPKCWENAFLQRCIVATQTLLQIQPQQAGWLKQVSI